jgi:hypothetical protein
MASVFELWHEDGLLFEDHPEWFVLLDRTPVVWTVRGLRLFRPRLALIGVDLNSIRTSEQFHAAWSRWLNVERELLQRKIRSAASGPDASLEARCLQAIADLDIDRAEALVRELEARSNT